MKSCMLQKNCGISMKVAKKQKKKAKRVSPVKTIMLMLFCTLFTSLGQLFWKFSAKYFSPTLQGTILNPFLIIGFASYGVGAILLIYALKRADLSFVYPFVSLSFLWVTFLSYFILHEPITLLNSLGILSIIAGVIFISRGGS
jgi:drug/metabolite transporter (DMT)-like permease